MRSAFPIGKSIQEESFRDLQIQNENLFTNEMEEAFYSNPYLLAVVAQVANIFMEDKAEIACIQGALFMLHMVNLSSILNKTHSPFVTEEDMFSLVESMSPTDESLEVFIAQEISDKKKKGDGVLFESVKRAQKMLSMQPKELIAFCVGMILAYDVLQIAA